MDDHRWRMCLRKLPYTTRQLAQQQADILNRGQSWTVQPYRCLYCGLYHVGRRVWHQTAMTKARAVRYIQRHRCPDELVLLRDIYGQKGYFVRHNNSPDAKLYRGTAHVVPKKDYDKT